MTKKKLMMMVAAVVVAFGAWAATETVDGYTWTYRINGDTAEIYKGDYDTAISPKPTGAVTIPSTLGGKPVTGIGSYAFYSCGDLTGVTIPDSVTSIGSSAFSGCSGLTSITLPFVGSRRGNSGTSDSVFGYIFGSSSYTGGTQTYQYYSSSGSGSSTYYYIPTSLKTVTITDETVLGYGAFYGCSGLTSVTIPDSVTSIGGSAFSGCSGLTSVTIPNSVTSIGYEAFYGCSGLTSVTIPDSVTSIGPSAFYNCSGLTSVTIPASVTRIGNYAFRSCSGLTSVTLPDSVTSIGDSAFANCSGLTSVTIPDSVTSLSTTAFDGCGKLWTAWYRTLANISSAGGGSSGGGSPSVVTTIVQQVAAPYALTDVAADRAIAEVTVDADCSIDSFVLKDGEVYDSVLYVSNTADNSVKLTLPSGFVYKTYKGTKPLDIPAKSQCMLSITRVAEKTFLVSREELEDVQ